MKRSIAYESTLEREFLIRSEADPEVTSIIGQPEVIMWRDGNTLHRHIPDFRIVRAAQEEIIEVKWLVNVPAIAARTAIVVRSQADLGRIYRVVSENWIRAEPFFTNAKTILRGRRQIPSPSVQYRIFCLLDQNGGSLTVSDLRQLDTERTFSTNALFAMVLAGQLEFANPNLAINDNIILKRRPC